MINRDKFLTGEEKSRMRKVIKKPSVNTKFNKNSAESDAEKNVPLDAWEYNIEKNDAVEYLLNKKPLPLLEINDGHNPDHKLNSQKFFVDLRNDAPKKYEAQDGLILITHVARCPSDGSITGVDFQLLSRKEFEKDYQYICGQMSSELRALKPRTPLDYWHQFQENFQHLMVVVLAIALASGILGFLASGERLDDAIFYTLTMFIMNYSDEPVNLAVNIARFMAALFTVVETLHFIQTFRRYIAGKWRSLMHRDKSTFVYGTDDDAKTLLLNLGDKGIGANENDFVQPAHRYVLMDDEQKNFAYLEKHKEEFSKGASIYVKTESLSGLMITLNDEAHPRLRLFSLEEIGARAFWFLHPLIYEFNYYEFNNAHSISLLEPHEFQVHIIGMNHLAEELLFYGVQANVYGDNQKVDYYVYGNTKKYGELHSHLKELNIHLVNDSWQNHLRSIHSADVLILADQDKQAGIINDLFTFSGDWTNTSIYVFSNMIIKNPAIFLDHKCGKVQARKLDIIDWKKKANTIENITGDYFIEEAKKINFNYALYWQKFKEGQDNALADADEAWMKLDSSYLKYSNIGPAYLTAILDNLSQNGYDIYDLKGKHPDDAGKIRAELEHQRWCNYHLISNWNPLKNGEEKNVSKRLHPDLKAFDELSEEEREKDIRQAKG